MLFEGSRRSAQVPNLTPLIDIVFLLLVFFMLTAHFVQEQSVQIELPQSESETSDEKQANITVLLDMQGQIHIKDEVVPQQALESKLRQLLEGREKKWVTVRGDKGANFGQAVIILNAARQAGAESVDIITEKP